MTLHERNDVADKLAAAAKALGFELFGISPAVTPAGFSHLVQWIEAGYAAEMKYFAGRLDAYRDLDLVLKDVRSVIVLGFPYRTQQPRPAASHQGRIARYAWGSADYHDLIHPRLKQLKDVIAADVPAAQSRGVVDSAPLMEREFAQLAGLGWAGKNSLLLNRGHGSYFFLSCLLTTLSLPLSTPNQTDHCGTCTRCMQACPTDAFIAPGVLDSRRCISYQTIENRGVIPLDLRERIGNWVFGCDVCQEVCPWNRFAGEANEPALWPPQRNDPVDLLELIEMDEESFRQRYRSTPLWRPRRRGLVRNAAICLGNAKETRAVELLVRRLADGEPVVRGAAAWALGRIGGPQAGLALRDRLEVEDDEIVRDELRLAIEML